MPNSEHTFDDLADWMEKTGKRLEIRASEMVGEMALAAGAEVAIQTPVDTGRARANWFAGTTDEPGKITDDVDKTAHLSIQRITAAATGVKPGESIFVFNNLPYINRLNEGSSDQAPSGFVEKAVDRAMQIAKEVRLFK